MSIKREEHSCFRFSIRSLLWLFVVMSLLIATVLFVWPRRTVSNTLFVKTFDVQIFEPHIDTIARGDNSIEELQVDQRTNSLTVTAQARNIETATKNIERLIKEPQLMHAASSLGMTIHEAQELLMGL